MIQLTDAHAHIKNEKQAMERITLGIPTMACAGTPGEMQELEKFGRLQGAEKILIPACGLHPWYSDKWEPGRDVFLNGKSACNRRDRNGQCVV